MKMIRNLSLVLAGFVLGAAVMFTPQIQAATSKLLGSKVGNVVSVKIDDKSIGQGAVINGTTYLPLRATANEMGLEVTKVDTKEVLLSSGSEVSGTQAVNNSEQMKKLQEQIRELNKEISGAENVIGNKEAILRLIESSQDMVELLEQQKADNNEYYDENMYTMYVERLEKSKKNLQDAETNLPLYKQKLTELEAELDKLEGK
ncbi:hypothetical protein [Paenibacillus motobuensis]